jgi:protoporphyrin/coproporphyrin ferrochelatase
MSRPQTSAQGSAARATVLLVNLGSPDAPDAPSLRAYLREFLSDPRVVEIPRLLWWPLLHGVILRTRPARSARKYASVWMAEGAPLKVWTERLATAVRQELASADAGLRVEVAMRYGSPSISSSLQRLKDEGVGRVLVLPLYPQYAAATTATVQDAVSAWAARQRAQPELRFVNRYHDDEGYLAALEASVRAHWERHGRSAPLVMSFHGIPRRSIDLGDPYRAQCQATAEQLATRLGLDSADWRLCFQSRFGKAEWLQPYTEPTLRSLAQAGTQRVDVICPGFACDCLETLEEIAQEARDAFLQAGGQTFHYIPCLNDQTAAAQALAALARRHTQGW